MANEIINSIDRNNLLKKLFVYYNIEGCPSNLNKIDERMEKIKILLKKDLRNKDKTQKLLDFSKYEFVELITHLSNLYDKTLFNKSLIKRIKIEQEIK
jgi:hypothetical protein